MEDWERTKRHCNRKQQYLHHKIEDTIRNNEMCNELKRNINVLMQYEIAREWNEKKQKMKNKIKHLVQKWKGGHQAQEGKWNGIAISDEELEDFRKHGELENHNLKIHEETKDPQVYDNESITENQKALLRLPPKFATYGTISKEEMEVEFEVMNCKLRWEERNKREREYEDWTREWEVDRIEREKVFDTRTKNMSFTTKRVTDMPTCRRIHLPHPEKEKMEVEMRSMTQRMKDTVEDYVKENCDEKGRIRQNNLTTQQRNGLIECKRKAKNGEQMYMMTDKSMRMSVDTPTNYERAMNHHMIHDQELCQTEIDNIERKLNAHGIMWARILKIGEMWDHEHRVKSAVVSKNGPIPELYGLRKDHKNIAIGDEALGPPTRPVCGASRSINGPLSSILSEVLDKISDVMDIEINTECRNTEEMIAELEKNNHREEYETEDEKVVFSTDVKALYPSLKAEEVAKVVSQMYVESGITIDVDEDELALYLALVLERSEITENNLTDLVKRWKNENTHRSGRRPGITTSEVTGGEAERKKSKFYPANRKPTSTEAKSMISFALQKAITAVMKHHMYRFKDAVYLQKEGGPIGLQLTGAIARTFMLWWDREMLKGINEATRNVHFQLFTYMRYVDDCNIVCTALPTNCRIEDGNVVRCQSTDSMETANEKSDKRTAEIIKEIANNICEFIKVEIDYPSAHENTYMPILDLEVKMENNRIMYRYYRKKIANSMVIHFDSAMPLKMKRTCLSNEVIRILRNTSREAPVEIRSFLLSEFADRLRSSGYPEKLRRDIIQSGWEGYFKQLRRHDNGECPMYRPKGYRKEERSINKMVKRRAWYKPFDTVLFCPSTPGGELAKKLRNITEDTRRKTGMKIKVIERVGTKISAQLKTKYNNEARCRSTTQCIVHRNGGKGDCNKENVVYKGTCLKCKESGHSSEPNREGRIVAVEQRRNNIKSSCIGETNL